MSANARSKQYRLESYCGEDRKLTVLVGEVKPRYSGIQVGNPVRFLLQRRIFCSFYVFSFRGSVYIMKEV